MSLKKIEVESNVDLKQYTHIKVGGKAKYFFRPQAADELRNLINDIGPDFYILGKGSNLLIKDETIRKPVIKLSKGFAFIKQNADYLTVGASTLLSCLVRYCIDNNLGGLHSLAGIPATVGGLLAMNASSFGESVSSYLQEVEVMDKEGEVKVLGKDRIEFGYRFSALCNYIILSAKFKLPKETDLKAQVKALLGQRFSRQDFRFPSCGCIFKNPESESAGFLIDSCGLKGAREADAQVSGRHANFIINLSSAKYKDVDYLIRKIKDQIYKKYSIILEEEIHRWQ